LSDADRVIVESELADIGEERSRLQDAVPAAKNAFGEAKKVFLAEKKKPENGKAFGQPINAKMDDILKKNGIDRAAMFGGTIEGNGTRKLMDNADAIIDEMEDHVLQSQTRFAGTDEEIRHVGNTHRNLLHCLGGYFSCLRTKRFHLTPDILQKGKRFRDHVLAHERYLGMSTTTKSHLIESHATEQQEELQGIGDIGEDFGERNHQDQAKADRRLGAVRNFAAREKFKSLEEVQSSKDFKVQEKIVDIKVKRQRGPNEGSEARQAAKRTKRLDARDQILDAPAPTGRMTTLRELRNVLLHN
jgi:hypothetical protein